MLRNERGALARYAICSFLLLVSVVSSVVVVPLGFVWLFLRARSRRRFHIPLLLLPLVCLAGLQAVLLWRGLLPQYGLDSVLTNLALMVALVFFVDSLQAGWTTRTWENAIIGVAVLLSLFELIPVVGWYRRWWQVSGTLFSFPPVGWQLRGEWFGNPNPMAAFVNLVWPIALVRLAGSRGKARRVLWGCGLCLFLVVEYYTTSRGAWVAAVAGFCALLAFRYSAALGGLLRRVTERSLSLSRQYVAKGVVLLALVAGLVYVFVRQASSAGGNAPIVSARTEVWSSSWRVFAAGPLLGHGLGSFPVWQSLVARLPPGPCHVHAHNFWLQVGAETGTIGVLLVVAAAGLGLRAFVRAWRATSLSTSQKRAMAAYAGAGVGMAVHHLVDHFFQIPFYAAVFLVIVALALRRAPRSEYLVLPRGAVIGVIGTVLGICLVGNLLALRGWRVYRDGLAAGREGDWVAARDRICEAARANPPITLYAFQCSLANAYVAYEHDDSQALASALSFQRQGLEKDPYWPVHWANLASLEWERGERSLALRDMWRAVWAAPRNALFALNAGWMEEQLDHRQQALRAYRLAVRNAPGLRDSLFFTLSPLRREVVQGRRLYGYAYSDTSYEQLLSSGRNALQMNRAHTARGWFQAAVEAAPGNALGYASLALACQRLDRPDEAWRNAQVALFLGGSSPTVLRSVAQVARSQGRQVEAMGCLSRAFAAVRRAQFSERYYSYVYQRPFLPTDLSPFLRRAGLTDGVAADFTLLADHLRRNGEQEESAQVLEWLERRTTLP